MPIARIIVELEIAHAQSLKDRRQVVRSMKERMGHSFNVSVAELDEGVGLEPRHPWLRCHFKFHQLFDWTVRKPGTRSSNPCKPVRRLDFGYLCRNPQRMKVYPPVAG